MKPSILIIADFPNWAYYEIQQFIRKELSDEFDIYCDFLIYNTKIKSMHPIKRFKSYLNQQKFANTKPDNKYDIVLNLAFYFEEQMVIKWKTKKTINGVFTDSFPPANSKFKGSKKEFIAKFFQNSDAMVCGSEQIVNMYNNDFKNCYYANMILNEEFFKRKYPKSESKSFTIGWTGNPEREFKGYYSHILPAIERLQLKYPDIKFKTRFSGPMDTLPDFYEDVDVIIIASDADAGPSLFGEASLMEIPTVSTNIGWPSQVIQDGVNGFIVEKNIEEIVEKIQVLYKDRTLLEKMSNRIREDFKNEFNKQEMIDRWRTLFYNVLNS